MTTKMEPEPRVVKHVAAPLDASQIRRRLGITESEVREARRLLRLAGKELGKEGAIKRVAKSDAPRYAVDGSVTEWTLEQLEKAERSLSRTAATRDTPTAKRRPRKR